MQQAINRQNGDGGRFRCTGRTNRRNPCETPQNKIIRPMYSFLQRNSDGDSFGGGDDKGLKHNEYSGGSDNSGGYGGPRDDDEDPAIANTEINNYGRDGREFQLVHARSIIIRHSVGAVYQPIYICNLITPLED